VAGTEGLIAAARGSRKGAGTVAAGTLAGIWAGRGHFEELMVCKGRGGGRGEGDVQVRRGHG